MKSICSLFLFFLIVNPSIAQGEYINEIFFYDWSPTFDKSEYDSSIANVDSSVVLLDKFVISLALDDEYRFNRKHVEHKLYYVGNSSDIEEINRLYIYEANDRKDLIVKVRTMNSLGQTIELDETKIKDVSVEEGESNYTILAIPGIEAKSFVEVLIIRSYQGANVRVLFDNPFKTINAEIYFTMSEQFKNIAVKKVRAKPYGRFLSDLDVTDSLIIKDFIHISDVSKGLEISDRDHSSTEILFKVSNIDAIKREKYSHYYSQCSWVDFAAGYYHWDEISERLEMNLLPSDKNYARNGLKWASKLGLTQLSQPDQIRGIESFIKSNVLSTESTLSKYGNTDYIWSSQVANETGVIRMAVQLLDGLNIPYRVYVAPSRNYIQIDEKFPFTYGLAQTIIYFPNQNAYMDPVNSFSELGPIPSYWSGLMGVRIRGLKNDNKYEVLKRFPKLDKEFNFEGSFSVISFDAENEKCTIRKKIQLTGEKAIKSRLNYHYANENERQQFIDDLFKSNLSETVLSAVSVKNEQLTADSRESDTLLLSGTLVTDDILSVISDGYLVNLGKVLGTRNSLYDKDERKTPIFLSESKHYENTIVFEIPKGFLVQGIEKLTFDVSFNPKLRWYIGEDLTDTTGVETQLASAYFKSVPIVTEGQLQVKIYEFYEEGFYPKEEIESLQNVVNAAYEFYIAKIKLVKE